MLYCHLSHHSGFLAKMVFVADHVGASWQHLGGGPCKTPGRSITLPLIRSAARTMFYL